MFNGRASLILCLSPAAFLGDLGSTTNSHRPASNRRVGCHNWYNNDLYRIFLFYSRYTPRPCIGYLVSIADTHASLYRLFGFHNPYNNILYRRFCSVADTRLGLVSAIWFRQLVQGVGGAGLAGAAQGQAGSGVGSWGDREFQLLVSPRSLRKEWCAQNSEFGV